MAKVKVKTLVDAAARLGVIEDSPSGRGAFARWLQKDPDGAQKALTTAIPATSTVTASRSTPPARETAYPANWTGGRAIGSTSGVRAAGKPVGVRATEAPISEAYPANWLPGRARPAPATTVHAMSDTADFCRRMREAEEDRMRREVWNRTA